MGKGADVWRLIDLQDWSVRVDLWRGVFDYDDSVQVPEMLQRLRGTTMESRNR